MGHGPFKHALCNLRLNSWDHIFITGSLRCSHKWWNNPVFESRSWFYLNKEVTALISVANLHWNINQAAQFSQSFWVGGKNGKVGVWSRQEPAVKLSYWSRLISSAFVGKCLAISRVVSQNDLAKSVVHISLPQFPDVLTSETRWLSCKRSLHGITRTFYLLSVLMHEMQITGICKFIMWNLLCAYKQHHASVTPNFMIFNFSPLSFCSWLPTY